MNETIYVGIVEDHLLFREGMKAILGNWPEIDVVFESSDGHSVVDKLHNCSQLPHVLLVDLSLPPKSESEDYSGVHLTNDLQKSFPEIKILVLSVHDDENFISQLIENGAHGYLVKDCDPNEVHEAIHAVFKKGVYINQRSLSALQNKLNDKRKSKPLFQANDNLTKREVEIVELICQQLTTDEIAEKLYISPKTVNGHRNNLLQKTGCKNTAGLVVYAMKNKIVSIL